MRASALALLFTVDAANTTLSPPRRRATTSSCHDTRCGFACGGARACWVSGACAKSAACAPPASALARFTKTMGEQWASARALVGLPAAWPGGAERSLHAFLDRRMYTLSRTKRDPAHPRHRVHRYCVGRYRRAEGKDVDLCYIRIYKSGNDMLCENFERPLFKFGKRAQQATCEGGPNRVVFTAVRDPLAHFVSGFAELAFRYAHAAQQNDRARPVLEAYARRGVEFARAIDAERAAAPRRRPDGAGVPLAFVRDFVSGKFQGSFDDAADVHAWPQVAYVALHVRERQPVHLVADLGAMARGWAAVGGLAGAGGDWPPLDATLGQHDSAQRQPWRRRMEDALGANGTLLEAVCRVLLPDYACFGALGFELPDHCARAIGKHDLKCPFDLGLQGG